MCRARRKHSAAIRYHQGQPLVRLKSVALHAGIKLRRWCEVDIVWLRAKNRTSILLLLPTNHEGLNKNRHTVGVVTTASGQLTTTVAGKSLSHLSVLVVPAVLFLWITRISSATPQYEKKGVRDSTVDSAGIFTACDVAKAWAAAWVMTRACRARTSTHTKEDPGSAQRCVHVLSAKSLQQRPATSDRSRSESSPWHAEGPPLLFHVGLSITHKQPTQDNTSKCHTTPPAEYQRPVKV